MVESSSGREVPYMSISGITALGIRRKTVITVLCLLGLAGLTLGSLVSQGPAYEGKPISGWIKQLRTSPTPRAKEVLKKIGSQQAVPPLVEALKSEPFICSPGYRRFWKKMPSWIQNRLSRAGDLGTFHVAITDVLLDFGPDCKVALPELLALLRKPQTSDNIVLQMARLNALRIIASLGPEGRDALPTLWLVLKSEAAKPVMQRKVPIVNIAETIQKIDPQNMDLVLVLIDWVQDKERSEAWIKLRAIEILGRMGSAAGPAIPTRMNLKDGQDEGLSNAALDALQAIRQ